MDFMLLSKENKTTPNISTTYTACTDNELNLRSHRLVCDRQKIPGTCKFKALKSIVKRFSFHRKTPSKNNPNLCLFLRVGSSASTPEQKRGTWSSRSTTTLEPMESWSSRALWQKATWGPQTKSFFSSSRQTLYICSPYAARETKIGTHLLL